MDVTGCAHTANIIPRIEVVFIIVCYTNNEKFIIIIIYENSLWQTTECTFEVFKTGFMVY